MSQATPATESLSPAPRRWAAALCLLTWPLVWIGGLVTTSDAGMAVPDWPNTYGYNMFLYPWNWWVGGPWDLMAEHGHRLFASLVGLVTVGLVVSAWRKEPRRWVRWFCSGILVLVIGQGALGGLRVLENERLMAVTHGVAAQVFFALTAVVWVVMSRSWIEASRERSSATPSRLRVLCAITSALAVAQLTLGATLRHAAEYLTPRGFSWVTIAHLSVAGLLAVLIAVIVWKTTYLRPNAAPVGSLRKLGAALGLVVVVQVSLGVGAWLVNYAAPRWAAAYVPTTIDQLPAGGWGQTLTVTAHQATGALLLALLAAVTTYAFRLHTVVVASGRHAK